MDLDNRECFEIIEKMDTGFVLLDIPTKKTLLINTYAANVLNASEYAPLLKILGLGEHNLSRTEKIQRKAYVGEMILGYTVYSMPKQHAAILLNDITEKERLQKIAEATATMDNIGYIFTGFSHEVGNPLNSIKTISSVLKDNIQDFSQEKVLEYLESILTEINRIEYLLRMFKVFNAYEDLNIQSVNMRPFFDKFTKLIESDLLKRKIEYKVSYKAPLIFAMTDMRALQHVLLNVLTNAMDAVFDIDNPEINIDVSSAGSKIGISVKDNGIGIGEEQRGKIFFPFYTTKPKGTGMGLTIVKNLLVKMGGTIDMRSLERGTEVMIYIPKST
ncbi:HAMP domain-containing histidine kinase [candidate division WOR-3 bacterium]|nr:HAMP domain-containing histidine kinase [candidate division WOR-3 bacterium]